MAVMAKEKPTDRHKHPVTGIRLHRLIRQQLELLVERNASGITQEITIAIRERLQREGLWPPKPEE